MKSLVCPDLSALGYRLVERESDSVLRAKYFADAVVREIFSTPIPHWVNKRETHMRDSNFKIHPNGDPTGEFTREFVILGYAQVKELTHQIDVHIMMHKDGDKWGDHGSVHLHQVRSSVAIMWVCTFTKDRVDVPNWYCGSCSY